MATKAKQIIAMSAPVSIEAGATDGGKASPAKFNVLAYTGGILPGALRSGDERDDVIFDLSGVKNGKSLIANLDHEPSQRVGNVNAIGNDGKELNLAGIASAATAARNEVIGSAADGFVWQASVEADVTRVEQVKPGSSVSVNGQQFTAPPKGGRPLYIARESVLKGFAFVSHGADDNTTVSIAATAASTKEKTMKTEVKAWAEGMGIDVDNATPELVATIEANFEGKNGTAKTRKVVAGSPFEERKIEAQRRKEIREVSDKFIDRNPHDSEFITAVEKMHDHAIEAAMSVQDFRNEMYESMVPLAQTVPTPRTRDPQLNKRVIEAAICVSGRLADDDELVKKYRFTDQELQAAHDRFPRGISLNEAILECADHNGYQGRHSREVTSDSLRAATKSGAIIRAAGGFSPLDITTITSATANKFLARGFNNIDMTPLRIARIKSVKNFQQITTISLTGAGMLEQLGPAGEIKHKALGEQTYTNQADTYAGMIAITRKDLINDDLGALTDAPLKLGLAAGRKLNDIFWTEWLGAETAGFFAAGNNNLNSGAADMTIAGLTATEVIFMNQVDYDGFPLAIEPKILVVPPALKALATALMDPQSRMTGGSSNVPDANPFKGRFRVESSSYMANSSYTGYSAIEWYMIADPSELAVIEIVALNGKIEPTVEQADADFNVLGIQMRAVSDVGVNLQEKKAGVLADGNAS